MPSPTTAGGRGWRPICFAASLAACVLAAPSASAQQGSYFIDRGYVDSLYREGYQAYQADHCTRAIYYLSAYHEIARLTFRPGDAFLRGVLEAVWYCENRLNYAEAVKMELERYGSVQTITVEASGKADAPPQRYTVPFRYPSRQWKPKVGLPPAPPR